MEKEWKIGEIRQVNGEWYQCMEELSWGVHCNGCDFLGRICSKLNPKCSPVHHRSDGKSVIFKKLGKVGEPYEKRVSDGTFSKFQRYKVYSSVVLPKEPYIYCNFIDSTVEIEIKQTKDMGERDDIRPYDEYFSQGTVSNTKHLPKSNLKPFDIEAAKEGKPVYTRDGRKARIICFDLNNDEYPIVAAITNNGKEDELYKYDINGINGTIGTLDLMMLPEKRIGWINIKKDEGLFKSRDEAERDCTEGYAAVMVEFEI